jgi:serine-type D-Ala-D-Ala carboxypeptidase (penicillin-binding protein 5/6)
VTLVLVGAPPASAGPAGPELPARAWLLVDAEDGEVLSARRPERSGPIASTTKLMTAFVAREELDLNETVVAPAYVPSTAESLLGLEEGERIKVRDLLYGLILASGNDAAVALATAAGGSVDNFVRQMNRAAQRLDLDDTSYANPIGLDAADNFSSARDLVDLTLELREKRVFREIFDTPETVLESGARPRTVVNRNTLVRTVPYVNGVKTGYTLGAGNVLVGSAERDGIQLVSAVLGAPTESERDAATLELLNYGFSLYRQERVLRERERVATVSVRWQDERMPLVAERPVHVTVRRGQRVDVAAAAPDEVEGPVRRGERLGRATVTVDGELAQRVALVAARPAPEATVLERFDGAIPGPRLAAWGVAVGGLALLFAGALALYDRRRRSA